MATHHYDPDMPIPPVGDGAVRVLTEMIRKDGMMLYSEGPGHLGVQPAPPKPDPLMDGIRKHRDLLAALCTPDEHLTDGDKQIILDNDVRYGFNRHDDWAGAARTLRERAGLI